MRSRLMELIDSLLTKVSGKRVQSGNRWDELKDQTIIWGKHLYEQVEEKRQIWADSLEQELDVKKRYRRIQSRLAEDLAELEMRKSMLEKEVTADERMLFEEAYEHARKEIIRQRMQQASAIFYPTSGQKLRDEALGSLSKILRGDKGNSPKMDEA